MYLIWINCAFHLTQTHSENVLKYSVTYKPVSASRKKINVWAKAPCLWLTQLSPQDEPMGVSTYCKRKKNFGYAFVQNQTIQFSFLPLQVLYIVLDSVSSLLRSLTGSCSHPGSMNSASWCALSNPSANAMFRAQHNPPEEGKEAEGMVAAWCARVCVCVWGGC